MNDTLLIVGNPRRIPECIEAFEALTCVDVLYVQGFRATELQRFFPELVDLFGHYDKIAYIADDTSPTDEALQCILESYDRIRDDRGGDDRFAISGWVNMSVNDPGPSVCIEPLLDMKFGRKGYQFISLEWLVQQEGPFRASFTGIAFHVMSPRMWAEFPLEWYTSDVSPYGYSGDRNLSERLTKAGVEIYCDPMGFIKHHKNVEYKQANRFVDLNTPQIAWQGWYEGQDDRFVLPPTPTMREILEEGTLYQRGETRGISDYMDPAARRENIRKARLDAFKKRQEDAAERRHVRTARRKR